MGSASLSRAERQDGGQEESSWPPGFTLPGALSLWKGQVSAALRPEEPIQPRGCPTLPLGDLSAPGVFACKLMGWGP